MKQYKDKMQYKTQKIKNNQKFDLLNMERPVVR